MVSHILSNKLFCVFNQSQYRTHIIRWRSAVKFSQVFVLDVPRGDAICGGNEAIININMYTLITALVICARLEKLYSWCCLSSDEVSSSVSINSLRRSRLSRPSTTKVSSSVKAEGTRFYLLSSLFLMKQNV